MSVKNYDPNNVKITIAGFPIDRGLADGTFVTVAREADAFTDQAGSDGQVVRIKSNDNRATITITLMQSSEVNGFLSALHNSDRNDPDGQGVGSFQLQDLNGDSSIRSATCWVQKMAEYEAAREPTDRVWTLRCGDLRDFIGGQSAPVTTNP